MKNDFSLGDQRDAAVTATLSKADNNEPRLTALLRKAFELFRIQFGELTLVDFHELVNAV